jgi:GMP synthase (glutamine-hydrolysing)
LDILTIIHMEPEGPGTLGTFLESAGATVHIARVYDGDPLPAEIGTFKAIVSMGGPMNVYEEEKYPFLRDETLLLKKALAADLPVMGICLGAQMIAKAAGVRVVKSPAEEVGWCRVFVTEDGTKDLLFAGLPAELEVLQWHGDMFEIPEQGALLATGRDCPHQAFRYRNGFGLQFHVEVTSEMLSEWFRDSPHLDRIVSRYHELKPLLDRQSTRIYRNFLSLMA